MIVLMEKTLIKLEDQCAEGTNREEKQGEPWLMLINQ